MSLYVGGGGRETKKSLTTMHLFAALNGKTNNFRMREAKNNSMAFIYFSTFCETFVCQGFYF